MRTMRGKGPKKPKDRLMAVLTALGLITALIGAALIESENLVIPIVMIFGGLALAGIIAKVYWHFS